MVIFFLMLYLTTELGLNIEKAGIIISSYGFGSMLGTYLGGWFSDKIGTKKVQVFSLLIGGTGYIVLGYVKNPLLMSLSLFLLAIVAESFRPAVSTATANSCKPENRARGYALLRLAINLGVSIGPAIGGFLALYDYTFIFWIEGLTSIAAGLFLHKLFNEPKKNKSPLDANTQSAIISPWRDTVFLQLILVLVILGVVFNQLFNTWPLFLKEVYSFTEDHIGMLIALNGLMIVIFEMPLVHWVENFKKVPIIALGSFLLCFGFGAVVFSGAGLFIVLTVMIWSVGEMMVFPLLTTFIANLAHDSNRGSYMGMMTFTFSLSFVIGPTLGSWIYNQLGSSALWYTIITAGIFILPGFHIINKMSSGMKERVHPENIVV